MPTHLIAERTMGLWDEPNADRSGMLSQRRIFTWQACQPRPEARASTSVQHRGAAIELDNIILGRGTKTVAINQLIKVLESGIPAEEQTTTPMSMVTQTVAVMDRVVRKVKPKAVLDDVVIEYDSLRTAQTRSIAPRSRRIATK